MYLIISLAEVTKKNEMLLLIKLISSNGFILFIPILLWNLVLTRYLPQAYKPKEFDIGIPAYVLIGEGIFRALIFGLPLFMRVNFKRPESRIGISIFIIGVSYYFLSWLLLILVPESSWSKSLIGFMAPAYSIIIWLFGFSLIVESYYFNIDYAKWHFILPACLMTCFHTFHSYLKY